MQINSVNSYPYIFKPCNKHSNCNFLSPLKSDVFIKLNPPSFTGLDESNRKKADAFSRDLYKMFFYDGNFDLGGIQKIARKFDGDLSVKSMREAPDAYQNCAALCRWDIDCDRQNLQVKTSHETLYLNDSVLTDYSRAIDLYVSAVHEFTHAIQIHSKDTSLSAFNTSYLRQSKDKEAAISNIKMCNKVSYMAQKYISAPLVYMLNNYDPVIQNSIRDGISIKEILDEIYKIDDKSNLKSFVRQSINKTFSFFEKSGIKLDKKHMLNYIAKQMENECEAYENESNAYKRVMPDINLNNLYPATLAIKLHSEASRILKQMAKEY